MKTQTVASSKKKVRRPPFRGLKRLLRGIQLRLYVFCHKSRREPYPLYADQAPRRRPRGLQARIVSFLAALALLTCLAMVIPLRPSHSDSEMRDLAEFPSFSVSALMDGSYFEDLTVWFADTFPLRDLFLSLQNRVESLYGPKSVTIVGSVSQGDEIPTSGQETTLDPDAGHQNQTPTLPEDDVSGDETAQDGAGTSGETGDGQETGNADSAGEGAQTQQPDNGQDQDGSGGQETAEEDREVPELDDDAVVEQLSTVLVIDNAAYEYYNFVQAYADNYTATINRAADLLQGTSTVYSMIVPNSMGICVPESVREAAGSSDQEAAIDYMNSCLADDVVQVPVYDTLLSHYLDGEYLYFRSDHHWTAMGAYRAYEQFAAAAGFTPTPLDQYIEHEYTGFLGTFYNSTQSDAMARTPDTVYAYEAPSTNNIHITNAEMSDWLYLVIANVDNSSAGNKYGTFIGGDNPYSYIENPNLSDGSAVMVVKESYGNAFVPFLIENYQYVYVVDYRYISEVDDRNLAEMCEDLNVQDVLFLNTISTTRSEKLVNLITSFVG